MGGKGILAEGLASAGTHAGDSAGDCPGACPEPEGKPGAPLAAPHIFKHSILEVGAVISVFLQTRHMKHKD